MKKLMIFVLAAVMAVGFTGTALAATTVELNVDGGVSNVYWGPSFGTADSGASLYVMGGSIFDNPAAKGTQSATTLYAIANTATNAAGTELLKTQLITDTNISGSTPIGGPQLVSGTSTTVIVYVKAAASDTVGGQPESGNTLLAVNGLNGTVYWDTAIPCTGFSTAGEYNGVGIFEAANTGATYFCTAPVTIDSSSYISDALGGATIFGVSGATWSGTGTQGGNADTGVSVWAIDADTGLFTTSTDGNANVTGFQTHGTSGVSCVHAAPVVSGNSLFIIGHSTEGPGGNTIFQFDKNNLLAGVSNEATINLQVDLSDQWVPTPCVTGGSIFVVDNDGGVSSFDTQNLGQNYASQLIFGEKLTTGVTAGPVTNGTYIVFSGTTRVRCARVNNVSAGVSKQWEYPFGANWSIWGTPVISNGFVWVTANDLNAGVNAATTIRFTLSDTYQGNPQTVSAHGKLAYASPIIVSGDLWTVTYSPVVEKISQSSIARGWNYWTQFKFDAAKTGHNTKPEGDRPYYDDDSGCFISTIK